MPSVWRYAFSSGMGISPKWNTLAASAASAFPCVNASLKCCLFPAPPEAMTGMVNVSLSIASALFAYPFSLRRGPCW